MRNNIKKLCADHDISISELARRIGMQPHTLRRYTRIRPDGNQEAQPKVKMMRFKCRSTK
jgi:transposase-like protein